MKITNTLRFVALLSAMGLAGCKQTVIPDAGLPEGWKETEKVAKEFKVDDAANLGLPSIAEGDKISVFSTMAPEDNCEFTFQNSALSGEVAEGGSLIALYPYRSDATLVNEGGKLVLNTLIPYEQGISEITENSSEGRNVSRADDQAVTDTESTEEKKLDELYLAVNTGDGFAFKSLYITVALPIKAEYALLVDSIRIQAGNGEHLSGNIGLTFNGNAFAGIRIPEVRMDKVLYSGKLELNKNEEVSVKFNLLPGVYKNGFRVSLFKGNAGIVKEYDFEINLSTQENYSFDEFLVSLPNYYISYTSDKEITIDGYLSEYAGGKGKIYFSTSVVPDGLFKGNTDVKSVEIPQEITSIGESAFDNCTNLGEVVFAENSILKTIGKAAFKGASFNKINIPASVTSIGNYAFQNNTHLTALSFGTAHFTKNNEGIVTSVSSDSQLQILGEQIVDGCKALNSNIVLPGSIKNMTKTFSLYPNNKELILYCLAGIPPTANNNSFNSFGKIFVNENVLETYKQNYASYGNVVKKLFAIGTDPDTPQIDRTDYYVKYKSSVKVETSYSNEYNGATGEGIVYFTDSTVPADVFAGNTDITEIETSAAVKTLSMGCFKGCTGLTIVKLNEGLDKIEQNALRKIGVFELNIPASVTVIGNYAFQENVNLTALRFGDPKITKDSNGDVTSATSDSELKTIGEQIIDKCTSFNSDIVLPASIIIAKKSFSLDLKNLSNKELVVCCLAEFPPTVSNESFNSFCKIYVPKVYYEDYCTKYAGFAKIKDKLRGFGPTSSK